VSLLAALGVATAEKGAHAAPPRTHVAFVLLREASLPKTDAIERFLREFSEHEVPTKVLASSGDETATKQILQFDVGSRGSALVALMPAPVPNREADEAAQFSISALGTGWKVPQHRAHLVVTLQDAEPTSTLDSLSDFTAFVAAVAKASDAVGIYWGAGGVTHDPKFFVSTARERGVETKLMLWTGVSITREPNGRLSFLSRGMRQLELPDLLMTAPASEGNAALASFFDLLAYLAERGKPLPEGDTVGRTADERVPIRYVPSPVDPKEKVWRVELE
jgi:hypothetical protein